MGTCSGLDDINPCWSLDEVILLEVVGKSLDELFGGKILNSEEGLFLFSKHLVAKILN